MRHLEFPIKKKLRVLIVDDVAFIRKFLKSGLEKDFPQIFVDEATNGKEAQVKLENAEYDVVLCDWEMPGMTGDEVLHWVRNHPSISQTPFIMVTSRGDKDSVLKAVQEGVDSYLVKPFTTECLLRKVMSILGNADRRGSERFDACGSINLHFSDQVARGRLLDLSIGGLFSMFSRTPPLPSIFEGVLVDIKLENSLKADGIAGFIIRIEASKSFIDAENVKLAVRFLDLPTERNKELRQIINSLKVYNGPEKLDAVLSCR